MLQLPPATQRSRTISLYFDGSISMMVVVTGYMPHKTLTKVHDFKASSFLWCTRIRIERESVEGHKRDRVQRLFVFVRLLLAVSVFPRRNCEGMTR